MKVSFGICYENYLSEEIKIKNKGVYANIDIVGVPLDEVAERLTKLAELIEPLGMKILAQSSARLSFGKDTQTVNSISIEVMLFRKKG